MWWIACLNLGDKRSDLWEKVGNQSWAAVIHIIDHLLHNIFRGRGDIIFSIENDIFILDERSVHQDILLIDVIPKLSCCAQTLIIVIIITQQICVSQQIVVGIGASLFSFGISPNFFGHNMKVKNLQIFGCERRTNVFPYKQCLFSSRLLWNSLWLSCHTFSFPFNREICATEMSSMSFSWWEWIFAPWLAKLWLVHQLSRRVQTL